MPHPSTPMWFNPQRFNVAITASESLLLLVVGHPLVLVRLLLLACSHVGWLETMLSDRSDEGSGTVSDYACCCW